MKAIVVISVSVLFLFVSVEPTYAQTSVKLTCTNSFSGTSSAKPQRNGTRPFCNMSIFLACQDGGPDTVYRAVSLTTNDSKGLVFQGPVDYLAARFAPDLTDCHFGGAGEVPIEAIETLGGICVLNKAVATETTSFTVPTPDDPTAVAALTVTVKETNTFKCKTQ
jgi:hypothetical protein